MSERKEQFDVFIGGSLHLPHALDVRGYANARLQEIQALSEAIDNPQRTGLAFQQLPKHMRRRMMAHESKRLPRAVREAHRRQFEKSGLPPPSKKPSRKHRRRPKNLLTEYNRRQKEFAWLETHIWHAKRFYMVKKWGYNLANAPNNKGFRASYRASSKHCLLQDVSYLSCIELRGPFNQLIEGFRFHTSEECGLTFGANCFKDGASEGSVALYRHGMYPNGAIGTVSFLWKPDDKINRGSSRTIWIWIHPAFYQEVLDEFIDTFSLKPVRSTEVIVSETYFTTSTSEMDVDNDSVPPRKKKPRLDKKVEENKIETRNIPFSRTPKYQNDSGLEMVLLKDTLNRFRLTGPLSQAVLFEGLQIANMAEKTVAKDQRKVTKTKPIKKATGNIDEIFAQILEAAKEESSSEDEVMFFNKDTAQGAEEVKMSDWWTEFYNKNFVFRAWLKDQNEYWQSLGGVKTPAQLPPNIVIGLTIRDPRLCMPSRRKKAVPDEKDVAEPVPPPSSSICLSAIWDPAIRDISTQTKLSVAELNAKKSKLLVPGFVDESQSCHTSTNGSDDHSKIPVLLIQRPGSQQASSKKLGFGAGWDLVFPVGWGMPLWMALVFRGGRPGGLREATALGRESSDVSLLAPDSMAGRREADETRDKLTDVYFRRPPKVRPNFIKLGIASPFFCNWAVLVRDWSSDSAAAPQCTAAAPSPFFVLRNQKSLVLLGSAVRGETYHRLEFVNLSKLRNCLVPVALTMLLKGKPVDFSTICAPTTTDVKNLAADANYPGPVEVPHDDVHHKEREKIRGEHQVMMKRLRKRRVRKYRKEKEEKASEVCNKDKDEMDISKPKRKPDEPVEKELAEEFAKKTRELWLPEARTVKEVADRLTIGYVAQGDFVFTEACGAGVGYVCLDGLIELITARQKGQPVYVVVRNPASFQYRFAKVNVIESI